MSNSLSFDKKVSIISALAEGTSIRGTSRMTGADKETIMELPMTRPEYLAHLQKVIKATHGCESHHVETVPVRETFRGETAWEGDVEVYELVGHPKAKRCYAWAYDLGKGSRALAVIELPPVISPLTAVQAYIMSEIQAAKK